MIPFSFSTSSTEGVEEDATGTEGAEDATGNFIEADDSDYTASGGSDHDSDDEYDYDSEEESTRIARDLPELEEIGDALDHYIPIWRLPKKESFSGK